MVGVESVQTVVQIPLQRFWAAMQDVNMLLPKLMPGVFSNIEPLEGDGHSAGSVRVFHFGPDVPMSSFFKEKLEAVDEANHKVVTSIVEGGLLGIAFSLYKVTISFTPAEDGWSTTANWSVEYEPLIENPPLEESKQGAVKTFQAIEAFLLSNHDAYASVAAASS